MEEIPVEYNIIIEALNCAVQNQQQAEANEGQANFEFVVINNTNDDHVEGQGQSTLVCAEPLQHEQQVELVAADASQITFETVGNTFSAVTPATANDVLGISTDEQEGQTAQATEAIQPREKTHKCGVCNKAFLHAGMTHHQYLRAETLGCGNNIFNEYVLGKKSFSIPPFPNFDPCTSLSIWIYLHLQHWF